MTRAKRRRKASARSQGTKPSTLGRAGGRVDQAGEHLERGRLARAVGAEEGDHLARLDGEADAVDGLDFLVLAAVQAAQGAEEPVLLLEDAVGLGQALRLDDRHETTALAAQASDPLAKAIYPGRQFGQVANWRIRPENLETDLFPQKVIYKNSGHRQRKIDPGKCLQRARCPLFSTTLATYPFSLSSPSQPRT